MPKSDGESEVLLQELVKYFNEKREIIRKQWIENMKVKQLWEGLTSAEIEGESAAIYDTYNECLKTNRFNRAEEYATKIAGRGVLRDMTTEQIIGGLLVLRDVYGHNLFRKYQKDESLLSSALNIFEPVANRILSIIVMALLAEREKLVRNQQEAIRELSTPALVLRERLLILPIIGVIDSIRAKQLTENLLFSIRSNRAKVVVMDITGVPAIDSKVANHLLQTVEAARLLGAEVIVTGLSPEIAQTIVTIGVDLSRIKTIGDLLGGIEEADRYLGYKLIKPAN